MIEINKQIHDHLILISQLTDLNGGGHFRVSTFRDVAKAVRDAQTEINEYNLSEIPRCGKTTKSIILDFLKNGSSTRLNQLSQTWPIEAMTLTAIHGIGPKRAMKLYEEGYHNLTELYAAAQNNELDEKLANAVKFAYEVTEKGRIKRETAQFLADDVVAAMKNLAEVEAIEVCGSIRRKKATVKDIDILFKANKKHHKSLLKKFCTIGEEINCGDKKASIYASSYNTKMQVDFWPIEGWHWGAGICYATGSKEHNESLRAIAKARHMRINERGIYKLNRNISDTKINWTKSGGYINKERVAERLGGENEEDLYDVLNLSFVPPTEREGRYVVSV